jgi:hypothetical protein
MKKITFILIFLVSFTGFTQQLISFESGEGYSLGDVNGQDNWTVSLFGGTQSIENHFVSDDIASDGSFSLKLDNEPAFAAQPIRNVGAFYAFDSAITPSGLTLSFDINISELTGTANGTTYEVGFDNPGANATITSVGINTDGSVNIYNNPEADGSGTVQFTPTGDQLAENTWYNFRFEISGSDLEVFLDDVSIYTGFVGTPNTDITRAVCVHDNEGGFFYFDNFRIDNESLSVTDLVAEETFDFRYASRTKELLLESPSVMMDHLRLYNMMGQEVLSRPLSGHSQQLGIENLSNGIYIAQVTLDGRIESFKFSKN